MKTVNLIPYLYFEGNCPEAMGFYKGIFGGEIEKMTFGDVDDNGPSELKYKVMHAR